MYYIVILKLTFKRSCFFEDNIFSKNEICIKTKHFIATNFCIAYRDLINYIHDEIEDGVYKDCDVEILSINKVGDKI